MIEFVQLVMQSERAKGYSQLIRKVNDLEHDLIEVIKYQSKYFSEPDPGKKSKKQASHRVYVSALYNIICAMQDISDENGLRFRAKKS